MQRLSPPGTQGRVFGVSGTVGSIADTGGLPIAGLVVAQFGVRSGAALLAAVPIVA
jgi:hypothetical protein